MLGICTRLLEPVFMGDAIALEKVEETVVLVAKMCISCLILGGDTSIVGANKKGTYMIYDMR
jgi:hypothetical protein